VTAVPGGLLAGAAVAMAVPVAAMPVTAVAMAVSIVRTIGGRHPIMEAQLAGYAKPAA
jgi:hypothetical protein